MTPSTLQYLIVAGLVALLGFGAWRAAYGDYPPPSSSPAHIPRAPQPAAKSKALPADNKGVLPKLSAYLVGKELLIRSLKYPIDAKISDFDSSDTEVASGPNKFLMRGWILSQNKYGVMARRSFALSVVHEENSAKTEYLFFEDEADLVWSQWQPQAKK